jgi:hypothetical protein
LPALSIPTGQQYRPRSATNALKEIVEDSMEELFRDWDERFRGRYGSLPARVRTLLERFTRCGDLHFFCVIDLSKRLTLVIRLGGAHEGESFE